MKTISSEQFEILKEKFDPNNMCEKFSHDFAREIYCGSHTGDYICLKCYLYFNECDREKYCLGDDKDEKDEAN